jgi:hypothetical protein
VSASTFGPDFHQQVVLPVYDTRLSACRYLAGDVSEEGHRQHATRFWVGQREHTVVCSRVCVSLAPVVCTTGGFHVFITSQKCVAVASVHWSSSLSVLPIAKK